MGFLSLAIFHLAFTLAMVGFMTSIQLLVYPAFRHVREADFVEYLNRHGRGVTAPLILFAPAEIVLALLLCLQAPSGTEQTVAFISGLLLAIGWVSTLLWFGPFHGRLASEPYDPARIEQLISTNWLRTIIWWARGAFAVWLLFAVLP